MQRLLAIYTSFITFADNIKADPYGIILGDHTIFTLSLYFTGTFFAAIGALGHFLGKTHPVFFLCLAGGYCVLYGADIASRKLDEIGRSVRATRLKDKKIDWRRAPYYEKAYIIFFLYLLIMMVTFRIVSASAGWGKGLYATGVIAEDLALYLIYEYCCHSGRNACYRINTSGELAMGFASLLLELGTIGVPLLLLVDWMLHKNALTTPAWSIGIFCILVSATDEYLVDASKNSLLSLVKRAPTHYGRAVFRQAVLWSPALMGWQVFGFPLLLSTDFFHSRILILFFLYVVSLCLFPQVMDYIPVTGHIAAMMPTEVKRIDSDLEYFEQIEVQKMIGRSRLDLLQKMKAEDEEAKKDQSK